MTQESLFKAFAEIDDSFIEEAATPPKKPLLWLKITAVAACVAVLAVGAWMAWPSITSPATDPMLVVSEDNAFIVTPSTTTTYPFITTVPPSERAESYTVVYPDIDDRVVADSRNSPNDLACYARPPYPGECWIDIYGPSLADDVSENTVYWVQLWLYDDGGRLLTGQAVRNEAHRLAALGYEIVLLEETWTGYGGEKKHRNVLCAYFTKEHLEHFPATADLGYMIDYYREDVLEDLKTTVIQIIRTSDGTTHELIVDPAIIEKMGPF